MRFKRLIVELNQMRVAMKGMVKGMVMKAMVMKAMAMKAMVMKAMAMKGMMMKAMVMKGMKGMAMVMKAMVMSDVPKGDSATPQCALRNSTGGKYCWRKSLSSPCPVMFIRSSIN